jgi:hypothetical protein
VSVGGNLDGHIAKVAKTGEATDLGTQPAHANGKNNTNSGGFPHEKFQTRGPFQSIKAKIPIASDLRNRVQDRCQCEQSG